jgi:glutamine synthetase
MVAFELEFYLLDPAHDNGRQLRPPVSPLSGQRTGTTQVYSIDDVEDFSHYLHEVNQACARQGVVTSAISAEYAPGQFEINLHHSDRPLEAADQCVMFRRAVQCVARQHGLQGTFMAKPYEASSGSGLHLHISLLNEQDENVFDGGGEYGTPACASELLLQAIGGLRQTMADSMAIFAPNINSYRRFVPNIYVPVTASWGYENRSVAIRVPKSPGLARRIEHRVAGADANPYLTLAALLSGIHHGISNQLDAGEPVQGNAGEQLDPTVPFEPEAAFARFRHSQVLSGYFGQRYLDAYSSCKQNEYRAFVDSDLVEAGWYL